MSGASVLALIMAGLVFLVTAGLAMASRPGLSPMLAPAASPLVCRKLTSILTIDGRATDWPTTQSILLDATTAASVSGSPAGPNDASLSLRCAWDTQHLYVLADVSDDVLLADSSTIWDDDSIELALDGEHDRSCCSEYDHHLTIALDSRLADFGIVQGPSPARWVVLPRVGGYIVEASFPMTMFLPGPPLSGTLVGFNLALNDDDDGGRRDTRLLWAGTTILNFAEFGSLLLGGSEPPAPTATPTRTATPLPPGTPTVTPAATSTATPTSPPTPTRTATATPAVPDANQRVATLEGALAATEGVLRQMWAIMQSAGYLPGAAPTPGPLPPTPTATPLPSYIQRVRCGGSDYFDNQGHLWLADQPYTPGSWGYVGGLAYQSTAPIAGTPDQPLYQAERYNMSAYQFDLPAGQYRVELRFAEIYQYAAPNQRIFDVLLEGTRVITGLDLFLEAGAFMAYDRTFDATVADGQLNIDFIATKGAAKISAIKVTSLAPAGPPPTPSLSQRVSNLEQQMTELELLLQQILSVFDRFLGL